MKRFFGPACLAAGLLVAGCGHDAPAGAPARVAVALQLGVAPRAPGDPAVGAPDTLRVDLRGAGGELLVHPTLQELGADDPDFHLSVSAPVGRDRSIAVMLRGVRNVLPAPAAPGVAADPYPERGILYYEKITGLDLRPGLIPHLQADVHLFVPRFGPVEHLPAGGYRIHWNAIAGADRYRLTRISPRGEQSDTTVFDTTYVGHVYRTRYLVRAVEFSAFTSPAGDGLRVDSPVPLPPDAPSLLSANVLGPSRVQLEWVDNAFDEQGTIVEQLKGTQWGEIGRASADATQFVVDNLTPGDSVTIRVRAYNAAGNSAPSNPATATPQPPPG